MFYAKPTKKGAKIPDNILHAALRTNGVKNQPEEYYVMFFDIRNKRSLLKSFKFNIVKRKNSDRKERNHYVFWISKKGHLNTLENVHVFMKTVVRGYRGLRESKENTYSIIDQDNHVMVKCYFMKYVIEYMKMFLEVWSPEIGPPYKMILRD